MTIRVHADRTRYETAQRCRRARWYGYHEGGMGLASARMPLPLAVGLSVHVGLAVALASAQDAEASMDPTNLALIEQGAVDAAVADFAQYKTALELPTTEAVAQAAKPGDDLAHQLARSLDLPPMDPMWAELDKEVGQRQSQFERYLADEQTALVEGIVRAYCRRRLLALVRDFEILEVEREGQWLLGHWGYKDGGSSELWFMSRPDALLRERQSNALYLLSYKTAGDWDVRKARDAEHDMQGLSEGIEIERRLAEWWHQARYVEHPDADWTPRMYKFLRELEAPPRILAVRYEYLLKGERWKDKDLGEQYGMECRSQRSPLIRGYYNAGMASGDEQWNVGYEYLKDTGEESKLYWKNWRSQPVWKYMPVKKWIDMLDETAMVVDAETGGEKGYGSPAQATGYLKADPLEGVFVPPVTVYRNDDDLRDLVEQLEAGERAIAEGVAAVNGAADEGERRHLLNLHFPQTRRACEYPSTCAFVKLCYGGDDIRRDPLASGLYKQREVNHPQELEGARP